MKSKFPKEVKVCLWSYDTDKMSLTSPTDRNMIILNVLNHGTENATEWLLENFKEKEIKEAIKKSYASAWFKWRLKRWSQFYKVSPKWKTRIEYIWSKEKTPQDIPLNIPYKSQWPYGGDV